MNLEQKINLLTLLCERQNESASFTVKIGGVSCSGIVTHENLTILESPPAVFDILAKFKAQEKAKGRDIYITAGRGGINVW